MGQNKFSLLQYSILAVSVISGSKLNAQVNYTNLDPDIILDDLYETCTLDINNDGIKDFFFFNWLRQFSSITDSGSPGASFDEFVQFAGGYFQPENEIAGTLSVKYEYYGAAYLKYFPYALNNTDLIDNKLDFQYWFYQSMAFKSYINDSPILWNSGGFWFPNESEKFLGVRFVDSEDKLHYGWIRCSVIDSAEGLIIHDYAYEVEPDKPIEAGSTVSYVGVNDLTVANNNFQIYTFNNDVFINSKEITADLTYQIINLQGAVIAVGNVNTNQIVIPIDAASGIYLVDMVSNGEIVYSKKVIVN